MNTVEHQYFALEAENVSGPYECVLVAEQDLKQAVHTRFCVCNQPWEQCESDGIPIIIRTLDDPNYWSYPDFAGAWEHSSEDGIIRVAKFTSNPIGREADTLAEAMRIANTCLQEHDHGPKQDGDMLTDRTNPASCIYLELEKLTK